MKKITLFLTAAGLLTLAGCSANQTNLDSTGTNNNTSTSSQAATTSNSSSASGTTNSGTTNLDGVTITLEEAIQAYQELHPDTDITNIELDTTLGSYYYTVEGVDDTNEYDVKISASDGSVAEDKTETLDRDEQNGVAREEALNLDNLLPISTISDTALAEAGSGTITEWNLEKELSTTYWEVTVEINNRETSVSIDAQTGDVLEVDVDD
ncbi:PepSY domain-containing protein [Enterococcus sp. LJL90]